MSHALTHSILMLVPGGRNSDTHYTDGKTVNQRSEQTCPRSHNQLLRGQDLNPSFLVPRTALTELHQHQFHMHTQPVAPLNLSVSCVGSGQGCGRIRELAGLHGHDGLFLLYHFPSESEFPGLLDWRLLTSQHPSSCLLVI